MNHWRDKIFQIHRRLFPSLEKRIFRLKCLLLPPSLLSHIEKTLNINIVEICNVYFIVKNNFNHLLCSFKGKVELFPILKGICMQYLGSTVFLIHFTPHTPHMILDIPKRKENYVFLN